MKQWALCNYDYSVSISKQETSFLIIMETRNSNLKISKFALTLGVHPAPSHDVPDLDVVSSRLGYRSKNLGVGLLWWCCHGHMKKMQRQPNNC